METNRSVWSNLEAQRVSRTNDAIEEENSKEQIVRGQREEINHLKLEIIELKQKELEIQNLLEKEKKRYHDIFEEFDKEKKMIQVIPFHQ